MDSAGVIIFLAEYFPYFVAAGFIFFALGRSGACKENIVLFAQSFGAAIVARGLVEIIRLFVHRPRPFVVDSTITPLFAETSSSFPSGHASFFFALATVIYAYNRRWGMWFFIGAAIIGFARIAAGVHYPTDILGGAALGILVGYLVCRFFSRFRG